MGQAIRTTNSYTKDGTAVIRAKAYRGALTVIVPEAMHSHSEEAHVYAAKELRAKFVVQDTMEHGPNTSAWTGAMYTGAIPHEGGTAYVHVIEGAK